jgi:hypothetical protein
VGEPAGLDIIAYGDDPLTDTTYRHRLLGTSMLAGAAILAATALMAAPAMAQDMASQDE